MFFRMRKRFWTGGYFTVKGVVKSNMSQKDIKLPYGVHQAGVSTSGNGTSFCISFWDALDFTEAFKGELVLGLLEFDMSKCIWT